MVPAFMGLGAVRAKECEVGIGAQSLEEGKQETEPSQRKEVECLLPAGMFAKWSLYNNDLRYHIDTTVLRTDKNLQEVQ